MRCKVAPHVYQVVQASIKSHYLLHSLAAAISDTIPRTIATATASNWISNWNLFVFHFSPARYLDPILLLVRALELWVCRGILGCRHIPLMTKNLAPMILIRSTGAPKECLQLIHVASFLVCAFHFSTSLISISGFCPPSFTHGPCNYCTFEFRPRGTILKSILLAVSARFSRILLLHSGHRAGCVIFFPLKEPLLTLCKDESYFTLFARYSHVLQWFPLVFHS